MIQCEARASSAERCSHSGKRGFGSTLCYPANSVPSSVSIEDALPVRLHYCSPSKQMQTQHLHVGATIIETF
ncbi:hypothetical protein RE6C_03179 [Rhodopirellula europaea 6C]|uniref:Uncharacterized protein n=1 Tax=Rhodopirellula europaea 6C TaxID=1263867 RepID=M2A677_9BACT|nr:hypothetical protein RE6C_03179 [Rhodopirellula europaea 6C]